MDILRLPCLVGSRWRLIRSSHPHVCFRRPYYLSCLHRQPHLSIVSCLHRSPRSSELLPSNASPCVGNFISQRRLHRSLRLALVASGVVSTLRGGPASAPSAFTFISFGRIISQERRHRSPRSQVGGPPSVASFSEHDDHGRRRPIARCRSQCAHHSQSRLSSPSLTKPTSTADFDSCGCLTRVANDGSLNEQPLESHSENGAGNEPQSQLMHLGERHRFT